MTTMMNASNGKIRKSLASQLDRFDQMLDGLAEAIPEVVAETCRTVAAEAVREAVQAVLSNPEILARLRAAAMPDGNESQRVSAISTTLRERINRLLSRIRVGIVNLRNDCKAGMQETCKVIAHGWQQTRRWFTGLWQRSEPIRHFKYQIISALGIGALVGIVVWHAEPWIGAVASGVGGFVMTMMVQTGLWLRRMLTQGEEMA